MTILSASKPHIGTVSREFITQTRVIYAHTDKMGVVYHSKYLEFFEIARNELLRELNFPYKHLEERGVYMPLSECHLNYYRPAQYDDLLTIKTIVSREERKFLRIKLACSVFCEDQLLVDGYTVHVIANSSGRPAKPPRDIHENLFRSLFGESR